MGERTLPLVYWRLTSSTNFLVEFLLFWTFLPFVPQAKVQHNTFVIAARPFSAVAIPSHCLQRRPSRPTCFSQRVTTIFALLSSIVGSNRFVCDVSVLSVTSHPVTHFLNRWCPVKRIIKPVRRSHPFLDILGLGFSPLDQLFWVAPFSTQQLSLVDNLEIFRHPPLETNERNLTSHNELRGNAPWSRISH